MFSRTILCHFSSTPIVLHHTTVFRFSFRFFECHWNHSNRSNYVSLVHAFVRLHHPTVYYDNLQDVRFLSFCFHIWTKLDNEWLLLIFCYLYTILLHCTEKKSRSLPVIRDNTKIVDTWSLFRKNRIQIISLKFKHVTCALKEQTVPAVFLNG